MLYLKKIKDFPILKRSLDEEHIDRTFYIKFVELLIGQISRVRIT